MSHSHLAIRHLVKKLEMSQTRRSLKPQLPAWLTQFVDEMAERFEPFHGIARVGFECQHTESGWDLALFLGENEQIGGPDDGQMTPVNFRFDLKNLIQHFDSIESLHWNVFPNSHVCYDQMADLSVLSINGTVKTHSLRLQIHAGPPDSIGPGTRQFPDGRVELV